MSAPLQSFAAESLPWLASARERLASAWRQQRWPHGLLIYGAVGLGKRALARWAAQVALCERANETAQSCGQCEGCRLFRAGAHPDHITVVPEEGKQQISVDQIRELSATLAMTGFRQQYKVAVIEPAQQMTLAAANSLLKTLEEPAKRTMLILIATNLSGLLPTLRSRCQQLAVRAPTEADARAWLASISAGSDSLNLLRLASGAPLRALELAQQGAEAALSEVVAGLNALLAGKADVTQLAKRWANDGLSLRLECLEHALERLLRATLTGTADPFTTGILPSGGRQLNIKPLFAQLDDLRELRARLGKVALQRELALESALIRLTAALRAHAA